MLYEGYYKIILNLKTRQLKIINYFDLNIKHIQLSKQETRLLLFLSDNDRKANHEIKLFINVSYDNAVKSLIDRIKEKVPEIQILNKYAMGYCLITNILIDY